MPKTKFEEVVFTAVMSLVMVYGMICYNIALNLGGMTNDVFAMALGELKIMWPVAFVLELFVIGRVTPRLAFSFMRPTDRPQFITYAISFCTCALMCPTMSLIATFLFKQPSLATFAQTWAMNLPAALLWQFVVCGPVVRLAFRCAFRHDEAAEKIQREKGYKMVEDAGRGYRRVVPSPLPVDVVEKKTVENLIKDGCVVITVGGGGIPVIVKDGLLYGTPAVIDKDYASEKLAELIDADMLIILTAVEKVAVNFGKPDQKWLSQMTVKEAAEYCKQGQFAPGSMLPKVKACMQFAESKKGRIALITSLDKALQALNGKTGTRIVLE